MTDVIDRLVGIAGSRLDTVRRNRIRPATTRG